MSAGIAIEIDPTDAGETGRATRLVVIEPNRPAPSTSDVPAPARRWVWRTHDTPPVWVPAWRGRGRAPEVVRSARPR